MAESVAAGGTAKALFTPSPGISWLKSWQGIVEFCLRVAVLVLAVLVIIAGGVANNEIQFADRFAGLFQEILTARDGVQSATGWIVFVAVMVLVVEAVILTFRFLNFGFMESYSTIVFIVDAVISGVFAGAYLPGAIALAVYAEDWRGLDDRFNFSNSPFSASQIITATGATSAFSFFSVFVFVGLLVWMVLTVLLKWGKGGKHSVNSRTCTVAAD